MPITNIVAYFHWGNRLLGNMADQFRGGVTIEKRENLGQIPKGAGGLKKADENSQFQFGNLKNLGGSQFFKNV